jgi:hypothetical protein
MRTDLARLCLRASGLSSVWCVRETSDACSAGESVIDWVMAYTLVCSRFTLPWNAGDPSTCLGAIPERVRCSLQGSECRAPQRFHCK